MSRAISGHGRLEAQSRTVGPRRITRCETSDPLARPPGQCVTFAPSDITVTDPATGGATQDVPISDAAVENGANRSPKNASTRLANPRSLAQKGFVGTWIRCFLVLFVLSAAWCFATPLGGAPDEPAQVVKAAATVRGQLIGQPVRGLPAATRSFRVPAVFKSVYDLPACYQFHSKTPAGCAPHLRSSSRMVSVSTYVGRYPPLYYAVVGLPTLFMHSESVIYIMRLVSALLDALLLSLAFAIAAIWCRATMLLEAVALTVTPLVFFFAGVVNPNGFEIAAAICAWTSGLALVRNWSLRPPRAVLGAFVASGCLLELTRGLSVVWMALILFTLACLEPRSCWRLLHVGSVRVAAAILVLVGAIALGFVLIAHTLKVLPSSELPPHHQSFFALTERVLGQIGVYVREFIGVFGWLDTPSPLLTTVLWTALLGFLVILGLVASRRRESLILAGLIVGSFVLSMALIEWNAGTSGITWQARDGFPLYAGTPLLAGIVIPHTFISGFGDFARRRVAAIVAIGVGVGQLADFGWTLRRFTVGLGHKVNLFQPVRHGWSPPPGVPLTALLGTLAIVLYGTWLFVHINGRKFRKNVSPESRAGANGLASGVPIG
jgi:hypothetical protein